MSASLYNSWVTGWILRRLDEDVKANGMIEVMKKTILDHARLSVINRKLVEDVLKNEPAIVISNHPSQAEVLVLLGLLEKRDDAYLVADHSFLDILPTVDKHIIPVYINHRLAEKAKDAWKFKLLTKFHHSKCYDQETAHQKNVESINFASEVVNKGGLVVIFPAAGENEGKFMNGIGYMIKALKNHKKVKLVMAHVEGTSTLDYLRLIPGMKYLLPTIKFRFTKPRLMSKFFGKDAKDITKRVEKEYYAWVDKLR